MQKSILISIQPQHVFNILTGKKTLELRKSVPKNFEGWVYIYCTKSTPVLHQTEKYILKEYPNTEKFILNDDPMIAGFDILNGHVVARFWFDNFSTLQKDEAFDEYGDFFGTDTKGKFYFGEDILSHICIELKELKSYWNNGKLFAWHIKKLEVFDKSKTLVNYIIPHVSRTVDNCKTLLYLPLQKAPQSWMYVWVNE